MARIRRKIKDTSLPGVMGTGCAGSGAESARLCRVPPRRPLWCPPPPPPPPPAPAAVRRGRPDTAEGRPHPADAPRLPEDQPMSSRRIPLVSFMKRATKTIEPSAKAAYRA
ncbi:hypothetical protein GCM10009663_45180 [Kitasatospora arboriphila]|uniref:Uncharacterized protein n=1 Tax=Kitasatospora arboriphila TaxID=258052 RepID=A0ABN1TR89_9ACTN